MARNDNPRPLQVLRAKRLRDDKSRKTTKSSTRRKEVRDQVYTLSDAHPDRWVSLKTDIVPYLLSIGHKDPIGKKTLLQSVENDVAQMLQDDTFGLEMNWDDTDKVRHSPGYSYTDDPLVKEARQDMQGRR